MVQAALGDSGSSDGNQVEVAPDSGSEDELTLLPIPRKRRFPTGTDVAKSTPGRDGGQESLFITPVGSVGAQSQSSLKDRVVSLDDHSLFEGSIDSSSNSATDLLEQFQASKPGQVRSNSPLRSNSMDEYIKPNIPAKGSPIPARPQYQPAPSNNQTLQLGSIHRLKRVLSKPTRQERAVQLPSKSPERRTAGSVPVLSANLTPKAKPADRSQAVQKRQTQLPWGYANPGLTPNVAPESNEKSTQPSLLTTRHTMTPHFPPSKLSHQKPICASLRGGTSHPVPINRSPRHPRRARLTSSPPLEAIRHDHHEVQTLLNHHPNPSVPAGAIILGDLETSSEENDHRPPSARSASRRPSPERRVDQDIVLGDRETSSEDNDQRRPLGASLAHRSPDATRELHGKSDPEIVLGSPITSTSSEDASSPESTNLPRQDWTSGTSNHKKRRRSSDESGERVGGSWYRMVKR
ncbi:MAG: hypothetical protein Q9196_003580 [Gyalolechia fulgens]